MLLGLSALSSVGSFEIIAVGRSVERNLTHMLTPEQTFKRIGASRRIRHIHQVVLALSIVLQLDVFVLVVFFAVWMDQVSRLPIVDGRADLRIDLAGLDQCVHGALQGLAGCDRASDHRKRSIPRP